MLKKKDNKREKKEGKARDNNVENVEKVKKTNLLCQEYNKVKEQENNIIEVEMVTEKETDIQVKAQTQEGTSKIPNESQKMLSQINKIKINKNKVIKVESLNMRKSRKIKQLIKTKKKIKGLKMINDLRAHIHVI